MSRNSGAVQFLYGTRLGRAVLKLIQKTRADRLAVRFLWSPCSRPLINWYARRHHIPPQDLQGCNFRSFRDFFARRQTDLPYDTEPQHLISPCDGYLSAFPIQPDSSFAIKDSHYRLVDLFQDEQLCRSFQGGDCLIFRLCPANYHHYCYIDDGYQGENHYIPGELHSVQPIACATFPVYRLNRRVWTLFTTENFGPVIQTEIGALVVGGIFNERESCRVRKGMEMGHFELAGSTIVLFFQKNRIQLRPELAAQLADGSEVRVKLGMWIGESA